MMSEIAVVLKFDGDSLDAKAGDQKPKISSTASSDEFANFIPLIPDPAIANDSVREKFSASSSSRGIKTENVEENDSESSDPPFEEKKRLICLDPIANFTCHKRFLAVCPTDAQQIQFVDAMYSLLFLRRTEKTPKPHSKISKQYRDHIRRRYGFQNFDEWMQIANAVYRPYYRQFDLSDVEKIFKAVVSCICKESRIMEEKEENSLAVAAATWRECCEIRNDAIDFYRNAYEQPPFAYPALIYKALLSSSNRQASVKEIYRWFASNFTFYRRNRNKYRPGAPKWKAFVRDALKQSGLFELVSKSDAESIWTLKFHRDEEAPA